MVKVWHLCHTHGKPYLKAFIWLRHFSHEHESTGFKAAWWVGPAGLS
jgi:hypothetical protein